MSTARHGFFQGVQDFFCMQEKCRDSKPLPPPEEINYFLDRETLTQFEANIEENPPVFWKSEDPERIRAYMEFVFQLDEKKGQPEAQRNPFFRMGLKTSLTEYYNALYTELYSNPRTRKDVVRAVKALRELMPTVKEVADIVTSGNFKPQDSEEAKKALEALEKLGKGIKDFDKQSEHLGCCNATRKFALGLLTSVAAYVSLSFLVIAFTNMAILPAIAPAIAFSVVLPTVLSVGLLLSWKFFGRPMMSECSGALLAGDLKDYEKETRSVLRRPAG